MIADLDFIALGLDFVAFGLAFVAPGLDFVATDLVFVAKGVDCRRGARSTGAKGYVGKAEKSASQTIE